MLLSYRCPYKAINTVVMKKASKVFSSMLLLSPLFKPCFLLCSLINSTVIDWSGWQRLKTDSKSRRRTEMKFPTISGRQQ